MLVSAACHTRFLWWLLLYMYRTYLESVLIFVLVSCTANGSCPSQGDIFRVPYISNPGVPKTDETSGILTQTFSPTLFRKQEGMAWTKLLGLVKDLEEEMHDTISSCKPSCSKGQKQPSMREGHGLEDKRVTRRVIYPTPSWKIQTCKNKSQTFQAACCS